MQTGFDKKMLSLEATIRTKELEVNLLKKSIASISLENEELNSKVSVLNFKILSLEHLIE